MVELEKMCCGTLKNCKLLALFNANNNFNFN